MPDPAWSTQYNFATTPESNGFTRIPYPSPATVTLTTGGTPSQRKVTLTESDPRQGVSFVLSSLPSLNKTNGFTAEIDVQVSGSGNAGVELRYNDGAASLCVYQSSIRLTIVPGDWSVPTADNSGRTVVRLTCDGSRNVNVYRNGSLVIGPVQMPVTELDQNTYQWWGEEGGQQVFWAMRGYWGGAVAPG